MNRWYIKDAGKPALDFTKPIVIIRDTVVLLLIAPLGKEPNYQWLNLDNGKLNSGTGWSTPERALQDYSDGSKARNVDIASLIRQDF